jgi:hypothetical protein
VVDERPDARWVAAAIQEGTIRPAVVFYFVHLDCLRGVVHPDMREQEEPE